MTSDMNMNQSASEILKKPVKASLDHEFYLWFIIGCSVVGAFLIILIVAVIMYFRRHLKRSSAKDNMENSYIPGSEFCPTQMISSFSSSTSGDLSDTQSPVGKQFRRPLGPSTSLDPPGLLRLTSECVQPRPVLTRWHTVASPQCQTTTVPGTLDVERDSDDEEETHNPPCLHGRLWFSLCYNAEFNRLEIVLIKAKYLPGRGLVNSPRDPFVKIFLLPDEENFRQSKIRKRTLAPKFNEAFEFNLPEDDIPKKTIKLSVYDVDKRKVRHCLGHVILSLPKKECMTGEVVWRDLEMAPQSSALLGEVQLCLSCNPYSNRIKATVCRIRNLQNVTSDNAVVYLKVQLYHGRKMIKCKRTVPQSLSSATSHQDQLELIFDETFNFAVSGRFFDSCSFTFTVMIASSTPLIKDTSHGQVVIGPFMYARGEQLQHWQEMLSNPRNMVMRWHSLEAGKKN